MMKMNWFFYALIGTVSFSVMLLLFRYLGNLGVKESTILLYVFAMGTLAYLGHSLVTGAPMRVSPYIVLILAVATFFSYIGNLFFTKSLMIAPNPGYASAVDAFRAVIIAVAAIFLFGSEFSYLKGIGIILTIVGTILLGI